MEWESEFKGNKPCEKQQSDGLESRIDLVIFSQDIYCGGYSGEDPPLPIPNREVKLTIADGTAPPGGRVGSCHEPYDTLSSYDDGVFSIWMSQDCSAPQLGTVFDVSC